MNTQANQYVLGTINAHEEETLFFETLDAQMERILVREKQEAIRSELLKGEDPFSFLNEVLK